MLKRIREAIAAGQDAVAEAEADVASTPAVLPLLILDEVGAAVEPLRQRHVQQAKLAHAKVMFILGPQSAPEHPKDQHLREFLPLPEDLSRATGARPDAVALYLANRLALILDKWDVRECRFIGERAAEIVDTTMASTTFRPVKFLPAH